MPFFLLLRPFLPYILVGLSFLTILGAARYQSWMRSKAETALAAEKDAHAVCLAHRKSLERLAQEQNLAIEALKREGEDRKESGEEAVRDTEKERRVARDQIREVSVKPIEEMNDWIRTEFPFDPSSR